MKYEVVVRGCGITDRYFLSLGDRTARCDGNDRLRLSVFVLHGRLEEEGQEEEGEEGDGKGERGEGEEEEEEGDSSDC